MKCSECRGACCEQLILPATREGVGAEFLRVRGELNGLVEVETLPFEVPAVVLDCRCPKLSWVTGQCMIYETRPRMCAQYKAGGPACLAAVRRRRTPKEYRRIREPGDPEEQDP